MRKLILFLMSAASVAYAAPSSQISFYFAAHEDDWQLFMNPPAYSDVTDPKTKVVFVHFTAGDAGLGMGRGGRRFPYYLARENGARAAVRFMSDVGGQPVFEVAQHVVIRGHRLLRFEYRNAVAYFFRLPDGNPDGTGYAHTGFQSLARLKNVEISELDAIDSSSRYRGWGDLVRTVRELIARERGGISSVRLNFADLDEERNPGDHSDHLTVAKAVEEASADTPCARRIEYIDYASADRPENLSPQDKDVESAVFAITAAGVAEMDHTSPWDHDHRSWLGRGYSHEEKRAGTCPAVHMALRNSKKVSHLQSAVTVLGEGL